jgi:hypothetical protein
MCGDLDEDEAESELEAKLYARFLNHARALLPASEPPAPQPPLQATAYMERLFCDALGRSLRDTAEAEEDARYDRLALQPVVFARLAGFLAGHLSLGEDPLRKVLEALMLGYDEAGKMDRARQAAHQHGDVYVR